jgi:hypothetical protein
VTAGFSVVLLAQSFQASFLAENAPHVGLRIAQFFALLPDNVWPPAVRNGGRLVNRIWIGSQMLSFPVLEARR